MNTSPPLQPTLWRTCRVLANRTRLEIFRLLLHNPGQTVTEVAKQLHHPLSLTSEYLRSLEARGLLVVKRVGPTAKYQLGSVASGAGLVAALRLTIRQDPASLDTIFRLTTAFTHPRRVEIFRSLQAAPRSPEQLQVTCHISYRALQRHLKKLLARGFITLDKGMVAVAKRNDRLGRELARLARQ